VRKHWSVFYILSLFLVLIISTIAQEIVNVGFNLGLNNLVSIHSTNGKGWAGIGTELVALLIWWLVNRLYFHAKIGWGRNASSTAKNWLFLLPVIVVLVGDATLGAQYVLTPANILIALVMGLAVGLVEEYVFRGLLVSYLYSHFRLGAMTTACLSGLGFGLVHAVNGLISGNWTNTGAQILMAIGLGFFLAAVYLVTNNLWITVIFHAIIDAFDQIAFGTLSNNAGTSVTTAIIYFVVFAIIGAITIGRGSVKLDRERGLFGSGSFQRQRPLAHADFSSHATATVAVSPIKSLVAVALILAELGLGQVLVQPGQTQLVKVSIAVGLAFVAFLVVVWMFRDVLGSNWRRYREHIVRNIALDVVLMIAVYAVLALVRIGMKAVMGVKRRGRGCRCVELPSSDDGGIGLFGSLTVLMAPFTEELVFRHVLFYQWRGHRIVTFLMFFVSSIAFGLVHWNNFNGDVTQMVPYMVIGGFFALIYYFSRNIWQNIITHFLFDFVQFAAALVLLIVAILQH
jgi:Predicted protease of the Abi (CAAX) family